MTTTIFDTLRLYSKLTPVFSEEQARHLTEALQESTQEAVVTKGDLTLLKAELAEKTAALTEKMAELTEKMAALTEKVAAVKTDLTRWIVVAIAFNFVGTAGLFLAFARAFAK